MRRSRSIGLYTVYTAICASVVLADSNDGAQWCGTLMCVTATTDGNITTCMYQMCAWQDGFHAKLDLLPHLFVLPRRHEVSEPAWLDVRVRPLTFGSLPPSMTLTANLARSGFGSQMANTPMVIMWPNSDGSVTLSQRQATGRVAPAVVTSPPRVATVSSSQTDLVSRLYHHT